MMNTYFLRLDGKIKKDIIVSLCSILLLLLVVFFPLICISSFASSVLPLCENGIGIQGRGISRLESMPVNWYGMY